MDDDDETLHNHTKSYRSYIFVDAKFSQTLKHWYILNKKMNFMALSAKTR
jgi:hypothetical protein